MRLLGRGHREVLAEPDVRARQRLRQVRPGGAVHEEVARLGDVAADAELDVFVAHVAIQHLPMMRVAQLDPGVLGVAEPTDRLVTGFNSTWDSTLGRLGLARNGRRTGRLAPRDEAAWGRSRPSSASVWASSTSSTPARGSSS